VLFSKAMTKNDISRDGADSILGLVDTGRRKRSLRPKCARIHLSDLETIVAPGRNISSQIFGIHVRQGSANTNISFPNPVTSDIWCAAGYRSSDGRSKSSQEFDFVVTGHDDGSLELRRVDTWNLVRTYRGHAGRVEALTLDSRGHRIVSLSNSDHFMRVWSTYSRDMNDIDTGRRMHKSPVSSIGTSEDGSTVVSCSEQDMNLFVWDVTTGACCRTLMLPCHGYA
jgi:WD40 repeat protein